MLRRVTQVSLTVLNLKKLSAILRLLHKSHRCLSNALGSDVLKQQPPSTQTNLSTANHDTAVDYQVIIQEAQPHL